MFALLLSYENLQIPLSFVMPIVPVLGTTGKPLQMTEGNFMQTELNFTEEQEIWKDIFEFEKMYQISNFGRIKSLTRIISNGYGEWELKGKILIYGVSQNGYCYVNLSKKGKIYRKSIHRLVAKAFIENTFNHPIINHKDGNPQNNYATNLEWCTYRENTLHAIRIGLMKVYKGADCGRSKLTWEEVKIIRAEKKNRNTVTKFTSMFNVDRSTIYSVIKNKGWKE